MNPVRPILLALGIVLVIVGAYMLYFEAGLDRWVSLGVVTAGVLLVIGFSVMGFAGSAAPTDGRRVDRVDREYHEHHHKDRDRDVDRTPRDETYGDPYDRHPPRP